MSQASKQSFSLGWHHHDVQDSGRNTSMEEAQIAHDLRERIENKYGYGDNPTWRIKFYDRFQAALVRQPKKLIPLVGALMGQAARCDHPDRFFCKSFMREAEKLGAWSND